MVLGGHTLHFCFFSFSLTFLFFFFFSQPRMVLGGHTVAILVAVCFDRLSEPHFQSSVAIMSKV